MNLLDWSYVDPDYFLSSREIEDELEPLYQRLKLPEGRLELMTGISSRGYWPVGTKPSSIAAKAAQKIFEHHPEKKKDITHLIYTGVCRDFLEPATASVVHSELGLNESTLYFDLSNACLGFVQAMWLSQDLLISQPEAKILIVSGENAAPLYEQTKKSLLENPLINRKSIKPHFANLTIGSAGVAAIVGQGKGPRILRGASLTDSSAHHLCQGSGDLNQLMMQTDSEKLLVAGKTLAKKTWFQGMETLGWKKEEITQVIGHQVGIAHEKEVLEACQAYDLPKGQTYPKYGNTGSAALPLTLFKELEKNPMAEGLRIALLGIGSGLSCQMMGIES